MNCIVVDDEPLARKGMKMLIEQVPRLQLLGLFSNALEADEFLKNNSVDIMFLDIQMPLINGMEYLKSSKREIKVVITSAYPQFAVEAFELDVVDYLVKPIRFERFYKAINKVANSISANIEKTKSEEEYIFIRSERKYIRTKYDDIDYIEGLKDYVIIYCGNDKHMVATNLKGIHAGLPESLFMRISKSYIVNLSKIISVDTDWVKIPAKQLPIGENYKKTIHDFISQQKILRR